MKVLGLDLSMHTGFALFIDGKLDEFGTLEAQKTFDQYDNYPFNYVNFSRDFTRYLIECLVIRLKPDVIVLEQTVLGRARFSQKKLEFLHCMLLDQLKDLRPQVIYVDVSAWRKQLELKATKEDLKNNRKVCEAKRKGIKKSELGLTGKITPKHRSVKRVNEKYGLDLKIGQNDTADAINLTEAYLGGARICNGK
jgi:hypothetical protein